MNKLPLQGRTLALLAVIIPLLVLFIYVGLRSGPLAPVAVTVSSVESRAITPALFGIGTVEARYTYKIGPTFAGRVKRLEVHVGDQVKAGQVLGEMEPVDLDDRVRSQESAFKRAEAALREAKARQAYAQTQARRYEQLLAVRFISEEIVTTKQQELQIADAALSAAREDIARARSDREGLVAQRSNLRLIAPVDGVVAVRDADPGTTIVAGEAVVEVIDPKSLWINVRFDQISAAGLAGGLPARRARFNLRVALCEALANAIVYGNALDPLKWVEIEVTADDDQFAVRVVDQGSGFNPEGVPEPVLPDDIESVSGRGLFLIRRLMDAVSFNDQGNAICMVLRRA